MGENFRKTPGLLRVFTRFLIWKRFWSHKRWENRNEGFLRSSGWLQFINIIFISVGDMIFAFLVLTCKSVLFLPVLAVYGDATYHVEFFTQSVALYARWGEKKTDLQVKTRNTNIKSHNNTFINKVNPRA